MNKIAHEKSKLFLILRALLSSYIFTSAILLLLALLMYKTDLSGTIVSIGIILAYILSSFLGGILIGKGVGQQKFLWGIVLGVLYFLIILLVSFLLNKSTFGSIGSMATVFVMCTLGGMLGGMVS